MKTLGPQKILVEENKRLQVENEFLKKTLKEIKTHLKNIVYDQKKRGRLYDYSLFLN